MRIKYTRLGREYEIVAEEGRTLLDTALIARIDPPYSCMEGSCGTCEALIEEGTTSENASPGSVVRTCQAVPSSVFVSVNYDKSPTK